MTTIPIPESALTPEGATMLAEWAHDTAKREQDQ